MGWHRGNRIECFYDLSRLRPSSPFDRLKVILSVVEGSAEVQAQGHPEQG